MDQPVKDDGAGDGGPQDPRQIMEAHIAPEPAEETEPPETGRIVEQDDRETLNRKVTIPRRHGSFETEQEGGQVRSDDQGKLNPYYQHHSMLDDEFSIAGGDVREDGEEMLFHRRLLTWRI